MSSAVRTGRNLEIFPGTATDKCCHLAVNHSDRKYLNKYGKRIGKIPLYDADHNAILKDVHYWDGNSGEEE